jgi:hypothetical protein
MTCLEFHSKSSFTGIWNSGFDYFTLIKVERIIGMLINKIKLFLTFCNIKKRKDSKINVY